MTRRERVRRFLDGELSAELEQRFIADAEQDSALRAEFAQAKVARDALQLLKSSPAPTSNLAARSLASALSAAASPDPTLLESVRRLLSPRWVRVRLSPALIVLPLVAAALLWFGARHGAQPVASATEAAAAPGVAEAEASPVTEDAMPVRFVLPAEGAHRVSVAGDFNGWDPEAIELVDDDGDGVFVGMAYVPRGDWSYMFVVDGTRWVPDPYAQSFRDDGFGGRNAVLRIN